MAKGVIYCMKTIVPGLIKLGMTGLDNFESRMYNLEHNGYSNVVGLKRFFAIEVDDYGDKEKMLDEIFAKSRVGNTELFSIDANLVVQLLSSLEGRQIYPEDSSKDEVFNEATQGRGVEELPDGEYYLNKKGLKATLVKDGSRLYVRKGSSIAKTPTKSFSGKPRRVWESLNTSDGILHEDLECTSPSLGSAVVLASSSNGWADWETKEGKPIGSYRQ